MRFSNPNPRFIGTIERSTPMARPGRPVDSYREGEGARRPSDSSFFQDIGRLARATGALARDHVLLAQAEAKQEGRRVAVNLGVGSLALPFALAALIMLSTALAIGLGGWVGMGWGFLIAGGVDLLLAGTFGAYAATKLKEERGRALRRTKEELRKDREVARAFVRRTKECPRIPASSLHSDRYARETGEGGVHPPDLR